MENTFSPLILGCDPTTNTCLSFVLKVPVPLVSLEDCQKSLSIGLDYFQSLHPTLEFLSQCVNWAGM